MKQRSWPVIFEVTIRSLEGPKATHRVLTWFGVEKAVAMATKTDGRGFGTLQGMYQVEARELGPAPASKDGTVDITGSIHDRMEF